jgi:prophage regulatory protein
MEQMNHKEQRSFVERLLTVWQVSEMTTLPKPSIYRKIAEGDFPAPIRLGERRSAWKLSDVLAWIDSRARGCGAPVARKAA